MTIRVKIKCHLCLSGSRRNYPKWNKVVLLNWGIDSRKIPALNWNFVVGDFKNLVKNPIFEELQSDFGFDI